MPKYDITKTNQAIHRLLETTTNPRHRFLPMAFHRHRNLEMAGRYEEIFAPNMMAENPIYHFHSARNNADLEGKEAIKSLYPMWAETNQSIFDAADVLTAGRSAKILAPFIKPLTSFD